MGNFIKTWSAFGILTYSSSFLTSSVVVYGIEGILGWFSKSYLRPGDFKRKYGNLWFKSYPLYQLLLSLSKLSMKVSNALVPESFMEVLAILGKQKLVSKH